MATTPVDLMEGDFSLPPVPTTNGLKPAVIPDKSAASSPVTSTPTPTPTAPKFRRVIKGKDGAGDQVFEANTAEELIEKLSTAQENATSKIRELSATRKRHTPFIYLDRTIEVPAPQRIPDPTAEDVIQFQANPMPYLRAVSALANRIAEFDYRQKTEAAQRKAAVDFERNHAEDYIPCDENGDAIENYLKSQNAPINLHNLEAAYSYLVETDGLPVLPTEEEQPTVTPTAAPTTRIEQPAASVTTAPAAVPTVRTSIMETSAPVPAPATPNGDLSQVANDISKMSLEDARSYLQRLMHAQRTSA